MPCKNQGMSASQFTTDLLDRLDAEDLRARLDRLESERAAILVLLRAARAKERAALAKVHRNRKAAQRWLERQAKATSAKGKVAARGQGRQK